MMESFRLPTTRTCCRGPGLANLPEQGSTCLHDTSKHYPETLFNMSTAAWRMCAAQQAARLCSSQRSHAAHRRGNGQVDGQRLVAGGAARGAHARARVLHRARAAECVPAYRAHRVLPGLGYIFRERHAAWRGAVGSPSGLASSGRLAHGVPHAQHLKHALSIRTNLKSSISTKWGCCPPPALAGTTSLACISRHWVSTLINDLVRQL